LLLDASRTRRLRRRIQKAGVVRDAWLEVLARADRLLEEEFVPQDRAEKGDGDILHGDYGKPSGQIRNMGELLGLAWQVTCDEHYACKLREALLHYAGYTRWTNPEMIQWTPPWHSDLCTANFCCGYAAAYDCVCAFLSKEERRVVGEAMARLGVLPTLEDWVLPETRHHSLDSMGHNWWSVCVSQAGLAALSLLGDDSRAEEWVERVVRGFVEWFSYRGNPLQQRCPTFDRDGAFYESVSYANYALHTYLLFRLAYRNTFPDSGPDKIPLLERAGDFFLDTCYPTSSSLLSVNFGDTTVDANGAATARLLLANGIGDEARLRWYLSRTDPSLSSPLALLYDDPGREASEPSGRPTSVLCSDIGWAVFRTSWQDDATLLAIKSGYTWNHAHADAGSFVLFHGGQPLIIDSGTCAYGLRDAYIGYYCDSRAHNVILFNGKGQPTEDLFRGTKTEGRLHQLIDTSFLRYVYADATGPMARSYNRCFRHFLWVGRSILIFDDVRAHAPGQFEWLLHYAGEAERIYSGLLVSNGRARAIVRTLFPEAWMSLREDREGLADHKPEEKAAYWSVRPMQKAQDAKFVTAIVPFEEGEEGDLPEVEALRGANMLGARIRDRGTVTDVYLNIQADGRRAHQPTMNTMNGWETDAYLLAVARPEGSEEDDPDSVGSYFVGCGSFVRCRGKVVFSSLSKAHAAWSTGKQMEVALQGQPVTEPAMYVSVRPERIQVNGKRVPVRHDASRGVVCLSLNSQ